MHVTGNTSSSLCLFFVHGMLCDMDDWKFQIEYFSKNYLVAVCDLPGHGASLTQANKVPMDIPSLANYLAEQIASLNLPQKIILVGHSMAVRIVIELCLILNKKILNKKVDGLILLDIGYKETSSFTYTQIKKEQELILNNGYKVWLEDFFGAKLGSTTPSALRDAVMRKAYTIDEAIGVELYLNIKIYDYYALEKALRLIQIPILILQSSFYYQGEKQEMIGGNTPKSDWLSLVKRVSPNAQIKLIKNCGHWIMLQKPKLCNELMDDFIKLAIYDV